MSRINFQISKTLNDYFASADGGSKFYIGTEVLYSGNHGLANSKVLTDCKYTPESFGNTYGFWAWFLYPTAICESRGSYFCVNSYDRAAFTFSFMQFAAHVPNGDFVRFLHRLLQLQKAKDYFPFLELRNGRIWYNNGQVANPLENDQSTQALMNYFNPDQAHVDNQELISTARMVHWAINDIEHRRAQVDIAVAIIKADMVRHNINYNLHGMPDYICQVITDIHHQGRAKVSFIQSILNANSSLNTKYQNLLNIGVQTYSERVATLKAKHKELINKGIFGSKKYDAVKKEFVPIQ